MYLIIWLINRYDDDGLKKFSNLNSAKSYIESRIGRIKNKKQTNKKNTETLPKDEIFYLDLKVERAEKLKKINKRTKFKFW